MARGMRRRLDAAHAPATPARLVEEEAVGAADLEQIARFAHRLDLGEQAGEVMALAFLGRRVSAVALGVGILPVVAAVERGELLRGLGAPDEHEPAVFATDDRVAVHLIQPRLTTAAAHLAGPFSAHEPPAPARRPRRSWAARPSRLPRPLRSRSRDRAGRRGGSSRSRRSTRRARS